jgi:phosphate transport system substrate-binding protein
MNRKAFIIAVIGIWLGGAAAVADARDKIRIVGSSAVLPFVQTVAENFAVHFEHPSPSIDVTGAGKGFRLFCAGVGYQHPDINATARPVSETELAFCRKNGVDAVVEIVVGQDAIAVVNATGSQPMDFETHQLFAALSAKVAGDGGVVANPHRSWAEVAPGLPDLPIQVMGPAPTSTYYDAFAELVMGSGCSVFPGLQRLTPEERHQLCRHPRRDGAFVPGMNNDAATLAWLRNNPQAFAIVPFALPAQHPDAIQTNPIAGSRPEPAAIAAGRYPLARPIYLYVKQRHVAAVQGLQEFLYEFTAERNIGPEGVLVDDGFFFLNDQQRNTARDAALSLTPLER